MISPTQLFFEETLTHYAQAVSFVVFVTAALRISRVLPNSTTVRVAAAVLSVSASVQFVIVPAATNGAWTPAVLSSIISETATIWALSAIVVELALDRVVEQIKARVSAWAPRKSPETPASVYSPRE